jgi:antagonist of KipI
MTLEVLQPGLHSLIVDSGRPGYRHLGVPMGGAADRPALAVGNALVGNPPHAPALEVALAGPKLRAHADCGAVVYGAPFRLQGNRKQLTPGVTFTLRAGDALHIMEAVRGMRAYLCVQGGFKTPRVLGSRSALLPLRRGDVLECTRGRLGPRFVREVLPWQLEPHVLRVLPGRQADWFAREVLDGTFTVQSDSDRIGVRLRGPEISSPKRELISEPVAPGSIQVTPAAECIILGVDSQAVGGYPKLAQVISADLHKLAQLRAGDAITFRPVTLQEAEIAYLSLERTLRSWTTRLSESLARPNSQ